MSMTTPQSYEFGHKLKSTNVCLIFNNLRYLTEHTHHTM